MGTRLLLLRAALAAVLIAPALANAPVAEAATTPGASPDSADQDGNDIVDSFDPKVEAAEEDDRLSVIVMMDREPTLSQLADQQEDIGHFEVEQRYSDLDAYLATVDADQVGVLAARPEVRAVYENAVVRATLDNASTEFGVTKAKVDFPVTGDGVDGETTYSPSDVVIAIADTGIDGTHDALDGGKVIAFRNFIDSDTGCGFQLAFPCCDNTPSTPAPFDDNGHGTHVSSIAAGTGELNARATGVAPGAALVGIKVLNSSGSALTNCIVNGINFVTTNKAALGIEVLNLSLGDGVNGNGTDPISAAVDQAVAAGITVTVSAGNSGPGLNTIGAPGVARDAITVANFADPKDTDGGNDLGFRLARNSSRGPTSDGRTKPDIAAPGLDVFGAAPGDAFAVLSGTSMSSPFVAGVAALMLDADPTETPASIKATLKNTAEDWGPAGDDNEYGAGRLQAHDAIDAVDGVDNATGPTVPQHLFAADCLITTGDFDEWAISVPNTTFPLTVTVLFPGTGTSPGIDIELRNSSGVLVRSSTSLLRHEFFGQGGLSGNFTLRVFSAASGGSYTIDAGGASSLSGGADGCPAPPAPVTTTTTTAPAPAPAPAPGLGNGYVLFDDQGGLFSFGSAPALGSVPGLKNANPAVQSARMAGAFSTNGGNGYIAFDIVGRVFAFGAAQNFGSVFDRVQAKQLPTSTRVVAGFATGDGSGYALIDEEGGLHTFGAAPYLGSVTELRVRGLAGPAKIVGGFSVPNGYVMIDNIGGLFTFGGAQFFGSVPGLKNAGAPIGNARVIAGFSTDNGNGYVMIDEIGGLFTFGSARFFGSVPGLRNAGVPIGPATVVGGFSVDNGNGYVMIDTVGGLFSFGSARFFGSIPALRAAGVQIGQATIIGGFAV